MLEVFNDLKLARGAANADKETIEPSCIEPPYGWNACQSDYMTSFGTRHYCAWGSRNRGDLCGAISAAGSMAGV